MIKQPDQQINGYQVHQQQATNVEQSLLVDDINAAGEMLLSDQRPEIQQTDTRDSQILPENKKLTANTTTKKRHFNRQDYDSVKIFASGSDMPMPMPVAKRHTTSDIDIDLNCSRTFVDMLLPCLGGKICKFPHHLYPRQRLMLLMVMASRLLATHDGTTSFNVIFESGISRQFHIHHIQKSQHRYI